MTNQNQSECKYYCKFIDGGDFGGLLVIKEIATDETIATFDGVRFHTPSTEKGDLREFQEKVMDIMRFADKGLDKVYGRKGVELITYVRQNFIPLSELEEILDDADSKHGSRREISAYIRDRLFIKKK